MEEVLASAHENIHVMRHPIHDTVSTLIWGHHDKMIVVDQKHAFLGGIDMTFTRYDDHGHALTDPAGAVWTGNEYQNGLGLADPLRQPRIGWHDVGVCISPPAAVVRACVRRRA